MKYLITILLQIVFSAASFAQPNAKEPAVPRATNLQANNPNSVIFPFTAKGGFDQPGKWETNKSVVKGILQLTYRLNENSGGYMQIMEIQAGVELNGHWHMDGFDLNPPAGAYDVEYLLFIFHFYHGKESAGTVYNIVPSSIKKMGSLKLAKKKTVLAKPIPHGEMIQFQKKFERVKLNPQPIPPKTPYKKNKTRIKKINQQL
ncbi:hypothetical protein [Niabella terrae]